MLQSLEGNLQMDYFRRDGKRVERETELKREKMGEIQEGVKEDG